MEKTSNTRLDGCLYFSVSSLARHLNTMAEEAFKYTKMAPVYSYVLLVVLEEPGISQIGIAKYLNLKPSTITRFVDRLVEKELVERSYEGRNVFIYATEKGKAFKVIIEQSLRMLNDAYVEKLGQKTAQNILYDTLKINALLKE